MKRTALLCTLLSIGSFSLVPSCLAAGKKTAGADEPSASAAKAATPAMLASAEGSATPVAFMQFPSLSPDGSVMCFASAGDLFACSTKGGVASRITAHQAEERRSAFSPDGKWLAFESDRDGGRNLFVMPISKAADGSLVGGQARRVTTLDRAVNLSGWTSDGKALLFSASLDPSIYRSQRMYRAEVDGGRVSRLTDAFGFMPRMSADGSSVFFHRGRPEYNRPTYVGTGTTDIFRLNLASGAFTQMTKADHLDADGFPTADGSVVFLSSRTGTNNVYRLAPGATDDANAQQLTNFAPKGDEITIGHGVRDLTVNAAGTTAVFAVWDTVYSLDLTNAGASPVAIKAIASPDAQDNETIRMNLARDASEHMISPDGKTLAIIARGEVFVRSMEENRPTRRVTFTHGRERGLTWSPDGRVLWFSSDESGVNQIYYATVTLSREDITPKTEEEEKAEKAAAEKKDEPKKDEPKKDDKPADADKKDGEKKEGDAKKDEKPAKKKPDFGKRWAESLRFDVKHFDTSMIPVGRNDGMLGQEVWSPIPSPDGTKLLVIRGLGDLVLVDLKAKTAKVLMESWNDASVSWASDSRHIVYAIEDLDFNSDVFIMDTQAAADSPLAKGVNVTRHPDLDTSPRLSVDGKVLYFLSERANENFQFDVYAVFLDKKLEGLRSYELDEYFKKAGEAAKKRKVIDAVMWDEPAPAADEKKDEKKAEANADAPKADAGAEKKDEKKDEPKKAKAAEVMKFDIEDAYLRVRRIGTLSGSKSGLNITPTGDRVIFVGDADGDRALMSLSYKGDDKKIISPGAAGDISVTFAGDKVSFIKAGTVSVTTPSGGKTDAMPIDAPVVIEVAKQQKQKFLEAARIMGNQFYHPTLKGLNWKGLTQRYLPLATKTRTSAEFDRVFDLVLGELDGSHVGINSPGSAAGQAQQIGYLGVDVKPVPGGYKVTNVVFQGPADRDSSRINVGDVIKSVDGKAIAEAGAMPTVDFMGSLAGRAGKETLIELDRAEANPKLAKMILITPTTSGDDVNLRYTDEVKRRQAKVEELSGGKLGYLHIRGMSEPSVRDFERDLFAAAHGKVALLIDVRDNGGGSTADILLSSLTAPNHAYTVPRGADPKSVPHDAYPRDRRLIYSYAKPISVLINENSFSNAEIFAHAIKTIKRGKLVGTATFGGVISTGAATLIDGTTIRTPFRGWYLPDGKDYESNGAKPDLSVAQTPADEAAGKDAQLEAAVKELLARAAAEGK